jgi:hypothetical protein
MIQSLEGMDLADRLREMSGRIKQRIDNVKTEEATKTALVMPFINHVLGYNVFDPAEVVPEFIADVGTKKGEKVDYAIFRDGEPIMLFECKHYGVDLGKEPASQLYRYFSVAKSRFGVLTDGVIYRFYSDIDEQNKMDARPFLEINMLDVDTIDVDELKRFTKSSFDLDQILGTAKDLKYTREILRLLAAEWTDPSEAFVGYFASQVYEGRKTKTVIELFRRATKKALHRFVAQQINDRLKSAFAETDDQEDPAAAEASDAGVQVDDDDSGIITTEEELRAYYAVIAILSPDVAPDRIALRDGKSQCAILLDNNNRQPICRLYFHQKRKKKLGLIDEQKAEERVAIESVNDIFGYADRIRATGLRLAGSRREIRVLG